MEIFKQIAPLQAYLHDVRKQGSTVGLVPTMGALHAGHLKLVESSRAANSVTVSSIYVNPTQFNNASDLIQYPRSLETDTAKLNSVGCDVLFCPDDQEMYAEKSMMKIDFGALDKVMEGEFRPGHFSGVGIVVSKLFNIVQPHNSYFGQKDWQQFAIITRLVHELKFNVKLHSVATLREPDGLALSSRNQRLTGDQRGKAIVFYQALQMARTGLLKGTSLSDVRAAVKSHVESQPDVKLEYITLADSQNLNLLENVSASTKPILCIAGFVGDVRLIDNIFIHE